MVLQPYNVAGKKLYGKFLTYKNLLILLIKCEVLIKILKDVEY